MMFERSCRHACGYVGNPSQLGETQDAFSGVVAHCCPLIFCEFAWLIEHLVRNGCFSHVMEERRQTQVSQLWFRITGTVGQRDG